jgi:hypothetical protein
MNNDNDLLDKIQKAKQEYYSENQKNIIFKNKQKLECASKIVQQIDPALVYAQILSVFEDRIIFNYPLFKLVANPSIYMDLTNYAFDITTQILSKYPKYNIYVNLQSITITAIDRYKDLIILISSQGMKNGRNLLKSLDKVYIHNPPSFVETALKMVLPLLDPLIGEKIIVIPKN